jgi:hypothetical protein
MFEKVDNIGDEQYGVGLQRNALTALPFADPTISENIYD